MFNPGLIEPGGMEVTMTKPIVTKIFEDGYKPTLIYGPSVTIGCGWTHCAQMYFCHKLPRLRFSEVQKLYWQNDIDGVNNLISEYMEADDCKPSLVHFAENAKWLRADGLKIPFDGYEVIDLLSIGEGDVFFALDDEGDLVRAEVA